MWCQAGLFSIVFEPYPFIVFAIIAFGLSDDLIKGIINFFMIMSVYNASIPTKRFKFFGIVAHIQRSIGGMIIIHHAT